MTGRIRSSCAGQGAARVPGRGMKVAVITDSASDLPPDVAAAAGIRVVALTVSFGERSYQAGVTLSTEAFWELMTAPNAPFPTTAAASPGEFRLAFEAAFADGADAIVCVDVAETLSATITSARLAAGMLPGREIHVVDSRTGVDGRRSPGADGRRSSPRRAWPRPTSPVTLEARRQDVDLFVGLDTLAYLHKGGRLSGPQAAIGTLLAVKPVITVRGAAVEVADRPRTRSRARVRVLELLSARPLERLAVLFSPPADAFSFRDELAARIPGGIEPEHVSVQLLGPSVGPHVGPGCLGAVVLYARPERPFAVRLRAVRRGQPGASAILPAAPACRPGPPGVRPHDHRAGLGSDQSMGRCAAPVRHRRRSPPP